MSISASQLEAIPFFEGLDDAIKAQIINIATLKNFEVSATFGQGGESREWAVCIVTGKLQSKQLADDGRAIGLSVIGPGSWVGWRGLIDGQCANEEIKCLTECEAVSFPTRLLKPLVQSNTLLLTRLLKLALHTMDLAQQERIMLSLPNAFQRVCFQICQLSKDVGHQGPEQLSLLPRQQDLASAANTSRETVSRTLQDLIKAGVIEKTGHRVQVVRLALLKRLAYDGPEHLNIASTSVGPERPLER